MFLTYGLRQTLLLMSSNILMNHNGGDEETTTVVSVGSEPGGLGKGNNLGSTCECGHNVASEALLDTKYEAQKWHGGVGE